jgi:hypothetical protein
MARTVRDAKLETRTARARLKEGSAYWRTLVPGQLHLGYRKRRADAPGSWVARRYIGLDAGGVGRYRKQRLGLADDFQDSDGQLVLHSMHRCAAASRPRFGHRRRDRRCPEADMSEAGQRGTFAP